MRAAILILAALSLLAGPLASAASAEQRLKWNGREINGWICDGKELKPRSGATSSNTWDVGSAPILVIAGAVVLRLF